MKRHTIYTVIGIVTVSLFTISLLVSAQSQAGNAGRSQMRQQQAPGRMGNQGMSPGMNRGNMGQQGRHSGTEHDRQGMQSGSGHGQRDMRINWQELGLSEKQQEQLHRIQRDFQVNTATIRTELRYAQQDLQTQMRQTTVDQAQIDSLLNKIAGLKQQLSEAETQNFLAIKAILTAEQVKKIAVQRQPVPRQLRGVELTDAQKTQIGTIVEASRAKSQTLREELRELRDELQDLLLTPGEPDAAKLQRIQSNIAAKKMELEKERVHEFLQIKALLTPEQQEHLKQGKIAGQGNRGNRSRQRPEKRK